ncbi:MAG: hypothetical protein C4308_10725 [Chitinophagaceae bacterium]
MTEENGNNDFAKSLAVYLNGKGIHTVGYTGEPVVDDSFYIIFNAHHDKLPFKLPGKKYGAKWIKVLDSFAGKANEELQTCKASEVVEVEGRSVLLFRQPLKK